MEFIYETHMHTSEVSGCAVNSASQQVVAYKKRGYTGIIITDHFINGYSTCPKSLSWEKKMEYFVTGYNEAKKMGDMHDLDVFLGWEFTVKGADFLTYGLDLEFLLSHPDLDKYNIEQYSALVRKCGGYLAQAHPYRDAYYIEHNYPVQPHLIDGVEVYNSMDKKLANAKALMFALENDLPMQAGTDSHSIGNRYYSGIALEKRAESIHDIIDAIKMKNISLLRDD